MWRSSTIMAAMLATLAHADLGDELFLLRADDHFADQRLGYGVALDHQYAIVGPWRDDDIGEFNGAAYIFNVSTGEQIVKLLPEGVRGAVSAHFGRSIAIGEDCFVIGAAGEFRGMGAAYVFDRITFEQVLRIVPDDRAIGDHFGHVGGISGGVAIIGRSDDRDSPDGSGSAYLYEVPSGRLIRKLLPEDDIQDNDFGSSCDISGSIAIVGARGRYNDHPGSVYLFDTTTGKQLARIVSDHPTATDRFGAAVAIDGTTVIVGARGDDEADHLAGAAYLYDVRSGELIWKLMPDDIERGMRFGQSVAISGSTAIVGADYDDVHGSASGSAYLFDIRTGRQIAKLVPETGAEDDRFGNTVAITEAHALVGARWHDAPGVADAGAAYVFNARRCPADLDADLDVDADDFFYFLDRFVDGDVDVCDMDEDGDCDAQDFFVFLQLFAKPCD